MGNYTKNLSLRVSTRGSKIGYCAICRTLGELTKDHVPPKGCGNVTNVMLQSLVSHITNENTPVTYSQSGLHYRSICKRCNNTILGEENDPSLIEFCDAIKNIANTASLKRLLIPRYQTFKIKPLRIAKSVIGHYLAACNGMTTDAPRPKSIYYDELSSFFLDPVGVKPKELQIYCWPYLFRDIRVIQFFNRMSLSWNGHIPGGALKFFPLAFWITWDCPNHLDIKLPSLLDNSSNCLDEYKVVEFDFLQVQPQGFPEQPDSNEMIMLNYKHAHVATPK